ncbi:hypothetical protein HELRODRAFT_168404 [Helobdella robusta]|uniref:Uncharacterized protein n=1 Tax=Helobdella robusta TaxID=6412 RepID=T1F0K0_HELRO|nr:hypothetical protein HELRODRAFT_168404 [Helobdella robusta]ESO09421.1 hypothetical protein HELRODRAFT_168404 [Helobdella robusta]
MEKYLNNSYTQNVIKVLHVDIKQSKATHSNLPLDLIPKALEALNCDPQKGTKLASEVLNRFPLLPFEGGAKLEIVKLVTIMGFPDPSKEYIVENTTTSTTRKYNY